jgi:ParB/RepB/Spo0J family partition protein
MPEAELRTIPVDLIDPHPDNPRIVERTDVIEQISAELARGKFSQEHAVRVRPVDDRYQLVAGHNRRLAAIKAGIAELPAWVRDMDDDEAFMQLVLDNAQGELSPLEIGMHALHAVPTAQGSRSGGGLTEYAERIGRTRPSVSQMRSAAEVYAALRKTSNEVPVDQPNHLYEISKAPHETWPALVKALVDKGWSVKDTAKQVDTVKKFAIPLRWWDWFPLGEIAARHLAGEGFSPSTIAGVMAAADRVLRWIKDEVPADDQADELDRFDTWRDEHEWVRTAKASEVGAYLAERQAARMVVEDPTAADWHHGRWEDHIDKLTDGSVALLLTDPPYGANYQSGRTRRSKIAGDTSVADACTDLFDMLIAMSPKLTADATVFVFCDDKRHVQVAVADAITRAGFGVVDTSLIWDKMSGGSGDLTGTFRPRYEAIIHATKGRPTIYDRGDNLLPYPRVNSKRHPTEKPQAMLEDLINRSTVRGGGVHRGGSRRGGSS